MIGVLVAAAVIAAGVAWVRGWQPMSSTPPKPPPTIAEFQQGALRCVKERDFACAEVNWTEVVRRRPIDVKATAQLAIILNWRDKHEQAIGYFQKAIDGGEGTYDLFSYYADSLSKVGRTDEAIDWYYRSLSVYPELVDVRGNLAKLLVNRNRPHEALALLQTYDADALAHGRKMYFLGQQISIEGIIERSAPSTEPAARPLRLPKYGDHFYAPVTVGTARPAPFVVDTGAYRAVLSSEFLRAAKAEYRVTNARAITMLADGRQATAREIVLTRLRVGPFELKDVPAVACDGCAPLLGQSALSQFDMQSSKVQGVEFLTLTRRGTTVADKGR